VWQYFNPSARKPYALSEVLDLHANRRIVLTPEVGL